MRKFKLFFYPVYLSISVLVILFSIMVMRDMKGFTQEYLQIKNLTFITNQLPYYLLSFLLLLSILMLVEFAFENIQMIRLKKRVAEAEAEALRLKAKLYDRSQEVVEKAVVESDEDEYEEALPEEREEEGDDDEDEYNEYKDGGSDKG